MVARSSRSNSRWRNRHLYFEDDVQSASLHCFPERLRVWNGVHRWRPQQEIRVYVEPCVAGLVEV